MSAHRLTIILTDEAQDDLNSIALYGLLNWGTAQTERYHLRIADVLDPLARFPQMGQPTEDVAADVWSFGIGHHRIFYRVEPSILRVLRFLHERMNGPFGDGS